MMKFLSFLLAVLLNCFMGGTLAASVGVAPEVGAIVLNAAGVLLAGSMPAGALHAGVFTEIWIGELVKKLKGFLSGAWLDGIPDQSSIVNNDVIHLVDVGVEPEVLINNTTYPIDVQVLQDEDIPVSLDKFQTKATPVTDDELYAVSYDKMQRVRDAHASAIDEAKLRKAAHALCAQQNSATTPVLETSGEAGADGRKAITLADVLAMKSAMDGLGVPAEDRRLVLCPDHVNDLLATAQTFREQYGIDRTNGTVARLYGFDIYEFAGTPLYTAAGKKKAIDATAAAGEYHCSFAFYVPRVFKATGSTKMYYSEAGTDPQNQRNLINFRHYFIAMPKKADAGVVMMSKKSA